MARPKSAFLADLAAQAESDLAKLDGKKTATKLRAIAAAAKHPVETVAEVMGVGPQTIWRWIAAYRAGGVDGLRPKPKRPKPSKLDDKQKGAVYSWLGSGKTAGGEDIHWTLSGLRAAIEDEFGVTLGINTIWVWLRKEGWRQKVPRPRHHAADEGAQADFKKNSRPSSKGTRAR